MIVNSSQTAILESLSAQIPVHERLIANLFASPMTLIDNWPPSSPIQSAIFSLQTWRRPFVELRVAKNNDVIIE